VEEKRVNPTQKDGSDMAAVNSHDPDSQLREKPADAFVAVPYRDTGSGSMIGTCRPSVCFPF